VVSCLTNKKKVEDESDIRCKLLLAGYDAIPPAG
jgi:hypothetical protein